jgi:quaternary ammonium compound-resistance protein SugE
MVAADRALPTAVAGVVGGNERSCTSGKILNTIGIMAWIYLVIAGALEIGWAIGLKYTEGFSRLWPSVATISAMIASFGLLAAALKTIPVCTGYAVWTGIGAAGTAIIGMVFLGESREMMRILCLVLIVAGVVGLKFASASGH